MALATGAASALGEIGLKKLFGKGGTKGGSITIPRKFILMLPPFAKEFTKAQRDQINKVYKTDGQLVIKPTRRQVEGGFLGTLASIGIPMAISLVSKMFGSGLQVDRGSFSNTRNVYVPPVTQGKGRYFSGPHRPPPFLGTWEDMENKGPLGMGVVAKGGAVKSKKKAQRQGTARRGGSTTRKKQPIQLNSHSQKHFVMGKPTVPPMAPSLGYANQHFVIKPLSNFYLMDWVKKLVIRSLRGIYSHDRLPKKIKKECGIINLDDMSGRGTHWVCYRNIDNVVEYFDPFGLIMPNEALRYFNTSGKHAVYSIDEIQNRNTVLCGYWCLYYLLERQRGNSILDVIHNPHFDSDNSDFIQEYFGR